MKEMAQNHKADLENEKTQFMQKLDKLNKENEALKERTSEVAEKRDKYQLEKLAKQTMVADSLIKTQEKL